MIKHLIKDIKSIREDIIIGVATIIFTLVGYQLLFSQSGIIKFMLLKYGV